MSELLGSFFDLDGDKTTPPFNTLKLRCESWRMGKLEFLLLGLASANPVMH